MADKRFLPMYSDLPPTKEELLQLRLVEEKRKRGSIKQQPLSTFMDRTMPSPSKILPMGTSLAEFSEKPNFENDLKVIRSIQQLMSDPEYAKLYYKQATRPQIRPMLAGTGYGAATGALGSYALTGSGTATKIGAALGALAGLFMGVKRAQSNITITKGGLEGMVPDSEHVTEEQQDKARKFNKLTGVAAPAAVGITGVLAALRAIKKD